jgi:hypothetical protein
LVSVAPPGAVDAACAVFVYEPASMSACVTDRVAVHTTVALGASDATGIVGVHVPSVAPGSVTVTLASDTLPVLRTVIVYVTTWPAASTDDGLAVFVVDIEGVCVTGVLVTPEPVVVGPEGGVAEAFAVFGTAPASRSAWVSVCVALHEMMLPGASEATGIDGVHAPNTAFGSVSDTLVKVTLPAFCAVMV